jgi:hypothetical protein|tara:strand:- start:185 stop:505 length:321 start_codon:yes stop_codon:yes gene_type:complete
MQYKELKDRAKKLGIRVTKDVGGRRVKLTARELRSKVTRNFENSIRNAQKVISLCRTVVAPVSMTGVPPPPPPPPPPAPRKPVINATRAKLMAELKNKLKKRGMNK